MNLAPTTAMKRIGFYTGSFDPVTLGHTDVIARACRIVDRLVIAVGTHDAKRPLFTVEERLAMLKSETAPISRETGTPIDIVTFGGLAVDAARDAGAGVIVRGLRDATDFDYEMRMAGMNAAMAPEIETVFLAAAPGVSHIAANLVRQIAEMGGDVTPFVSPAVAGQLKTKAKPAPKG
jgi:pantetheine-phosphate adenylyltransferase